LELADFLRIAGRDAGFIQFDNKPADGLRWLDAEFVQQINQIVNSRRLLVKLFSVKPFKGLFNGEMAHEYCIKISSAAKHVIGGIHVVISLL